MAQPGVVYPLGWPNAQVPPLVQEPTPLRATLEDWTRQRAVNTSEADIHYEHSMYGYFNGILSTVFPVRRQFMVKPQGLLRARFDLDPANTSFDSNDVPVQGRRIPGHEEDKLFPDFLVVKATERMNADRIIVLFELKRDELGYLASEAQLVKYMERVAAMPLNLLVDVVGYLVTPHLAHEYRLESPVGLNDRILLPPRNMPTASDEFVAAIHAFAVAEWNT